MAELSTIARPYARAAFEYARDHGQLAQWSEQLAMAAALASDSKLAEMLNDPALTAERKAGVLGEVGGDTLGAQVRNFMGILSDNKRLALLPEISAQFAQYRANEEKSVDVDVISAFELADEIRDQLAAVLGRKLERKVQVRTSTDRELLGGVLIRAGDLVIDGSVRGKLNKLAEALNS